MNYNPCNQNASPEVKAVLKYMAELSVLWRPFHEAEGGMVLVG